MDIRIESLLAGAERAEGTVVVIDVFRAFTTAAVALARGASSIILAHGPEEALLMRQVGIGDLCMGEAGGRRPPGFDLGNSPYELSQADVQGKTLLQSTGAGVAGVIAAGRAQALYAASLVTAQATVAALLRDDPPLVTLVAMGAGGKWRADEDEQCALYLRNLLRDSQPDRECVRRLILAGAEAAKFGDPEQPHFHPLDREIALDIDRCDFAVTVGHEDGLLVARRAP
ncbi:MAG TPA: 2-phosphosulfolactate phosphatase [Anaerolineae bacterium]|nr:2-phosphosulfolactate phosphatase [Anaerolineae bacterium]HOQ98370.1 2-phosphosulfolactate phosphatase [Anaerolineae bacterium]HPL28686.1 2-phosphosulfolactate phosphatase [Anaerolineae bacterium]